MCQETSKEGSLLDHVLAWHCPKCLVKLLMAGARACHKCTWRREKPS